MAVSPVAEALRYFSQKLAADPTLNGALAGRWCEPPAPVDWADPFLVAYQYAQPEDVHGLGSVLLLSTVYLRTLIAQKGTSTVSPADLAALDSRMFAVLHRSSGTTPTGGTILDVIRVRPALVLPQFDRGSGQSYSQVGSDWSVLIAA